MPPTDAKRIGVPFPWKFMAYILHDNFDTGILTLQMEFSNAKHRNWLLHNQKQSDVFHFASVEIESEPTNDSLFPHSED